MPDLEGPCKAVMADTGGGHLDRGQSLTLVAELCGWTCTFPTGPWLMSQCMWGRSQEPAKSEHPSFLTCIKGSLKVGGMIETCVHRIILLFCCKDCAFRPSPLQGKMLSQLFPPWVASCQRRQLFGWSCLQEPLLVADFASCESFSYWSSFMCVCSYTKRWTHTDTKLIAQSGQFSIVAMGLQVPSWCWH